MNVVYHDKAKQWGEGYPLMEEATEELQELLANSLDPVEAEWDREEDKQGHVVYTLKLRDFAGEVKDSFTPAELLDSNERGFRVNRLLRELLRVRSHKLLKQMREDSSTED